MAARLVSRTDTEANALCTGHDLDLAILPGSSKGGEERCDGAADKREEPDSVAVWEAGCV